MSSRAQLSETLSRLIPGESYKRIREAILAAASYSGQRTDQLRQQIDEAKRVKTGLLVSGTINITSTTSATLSGYIWAIDYAVKQPSETVIPIQAPNASYSREDYFIGTDSGTIVYRAGTIDSLGNATAPTYDHNTEVVLVRVVRNPSSDEVIPVDPGDNLITFVEQNIIPLVRNNQLVNSGISALVDENDNVIGYQFPFASKGKNGVAAEDFVTKQQLDTKEPVFTKNTAFNKNFGITSGTVAQGDDSRIVNGQTAFGWGNHANAGYAVNGTGTSQVRNNSQLDARYAAIAHTHGISDVSGLQSALDGKEANFSKNTAFNKNFGTTAGTVAEGNDSRINNGQTAFGWGNHANAGYAVLGTGTGQVRSNADLDLRFAAIAHTHSIAQVTGLQSALDGKEATFSKNTAFNKNFGTTVGTVAEGNDSRINNGQTAFGWGNHANAGYAVLGTGTGQVRSNADLDLRFAAIAHTHSIAQVTGLQSALDGKINTALKGAANGLAELDSNGNVILPLNRFFGSGTAITNTYMQMDSNGTMNYNIPTAGIAHYFRVNGAIVGGFRNGEVWTNGVISTAAPSGSQAGQWRLGRALAGQPFPDRSIRIQIGNDVYNIAAQFIESIIS